MQGVFIESDFVDYYDSLSVKDGAVFKRFRSSDNRVDLLHRLNQYKINTIELNSVHNYIADEKLVIYTDSNLHNGTGKQVETLATAREMYYSNLASKFYEEADGVTIKIVHIGKRRFKVMLKSENIELLSEGKVQDITELPHKYTNIVSSPIYSIDYISTKGGLLATDLNTVQNLGKLGFGSIVSKEEVIDLIKNRI